MIIPLVSAGAPDARPIGNPVERTARPYVFDVLSWEAREVLTRVPGVAGWLFSTAAADAETEERQVLDYFLLARDLRSADGDLQRLQATGVTGAELEAAERRRADLQAQRERREDQVEALLSKHIAEEVRREGLATTVGPVQSLVPPVLFELTSTPRVLVVSPRERIQLQHSIVLRPGIDVKEMERIERTIEAQGLSVIVEPTGGFSTYPAMIPETANLDFALSTIVHEWLHGYLFFRPLGWHYFSSNEMRSINETVCDIGGNEIGARLAERYRHHLPPPPPAPPAADTPPAAEGQQEPPFDFNQEMRETRLEADRLLTEGKVEEAEQYMEARRKVFVAHGYLLRKLNQAYFAFHGTYGGSPSAVSPIFGHLQTVRKQSESLGDFLQTVSRIERYENLLALVNVTEDGRTAGRDGG